MSGRKIVIVGNGIAGFSAAATARRLDPRCALTMISAEATPLYSACVLPDYISGKISREKTFVKTAKDYEHLNIRTLFGCEVKQIEASTGKVLLNKGNPLTFDKLVLAIGSESVSFGEDKEGVFRIKTLADADALLEHNGTRAVIVGSGAIGIEVAVALRCRGYDVTIVETLDHVLPLGLDREGAGRVETFLVENGIAVRVGERATGIEGGSRIASLTTDKGEVACDTLVWAVGMRPRIDLIRDSGISLGVTGGILVDSHMEASIPGIYACGDCVESPDLLTGLPVLNLFWHNANRQGAVAGSNSVGVPREYPGSQNLLNIDVFGNHVVAFGYTQRTLQQMDGVSNQISVIEKERGRGYYRLVLLGDRCMGAQFINVEKDLGLIWSFMARRKSVERMQRALAEDAVMQHRTWLYRIRPFLHV